MSELKRVSIPPFLKTNIWYSYGTNEWANITLFKRDEKVISVEAHFSEKTNRFLFEFGQNHLDTDLLV